MLEPPFQPPHHSVSSQLSISAVKGAGRHLNLKTWRLEETIQKKESFHSIVIKFKSSKWYFIQWQLTSRAPPRRLKWYFSSAPQATTTVVMAALGFPGAGRCWQRRSTRTDDEMLHLVSTWPLVFQFQIVLKSLMIWTLTSCFLVINCSKCCCCQKLIEHSCLLSKTQKYPRTQLEGSRRKNWNTLTNDAKHACGTWIWRQWSWWERHSSSSLLSSLLHRMGRGCLTMGCYWDLLGVWRLTIATTRRTRGPLLQV